MEASSDHLAVDPPAYTATTPAPPTSTKRSMEDTRFLIFSNTSIIKPLGKGEGPIELVIGKTRVPVTPGTFTGTRSFTSQTSNVTIRINDTAERSPSPSRSPERRESDSNAVRVAGRHYAALVYRTAMAPKDIHMIMLGEPQDSIEEALEWMLDRTEIVITDMLSRHRKQATASCCTTCTKTLI